MYGGPGGHSMCHVTSDSTYVLKADLYVLIECDCVGVYVPIAINYVPKIMSGSQATVS